VVQRQPRKIVHEPPSQKYSTQEGLVEIAQVVEGLSSKHEAWNSNTSTTHTHTHTHTRIPFIKAKTWKIKPKC
jgi:hypothetical protein